MKLIKFVKEPLLHFLILAGTLFAIYSEFGPESNEDKGITVSDARMAQLYNRFEKLWDRPPSDFEMKGMIDEYLLDEIYAFQARELGLDKGDAIIRKRLRQKMEFMLFDMAGAIPPEDGELQVYLHEHSDRYRREARIDYEYISIAKDASADEIEAFMQFVTTTDSCGSCETHTSHRRIADASKSLIQDIHGHRFAEQVMMLTTDGWQGPFESDTGIVYVKPTDIRKGYVPDLQEIYELVFADWRQEKNEEFKREYQSKLLETYRPNI